jgi:hypothetical protein
MQISVGGKFLKRQLRGKIPHSNNRVMCRVMLMLLLLQMQIMLLLFQLHELVVMVIMLVIQVMVVMAVNQTKDIQMVRQMRKNFMRWLQVRYDTTRPDTASFTQYASTRFVRGINTSQ